MEVTRGAHGDAGKEALPLGDAGEPSPYNPAEYLLFEGESGGRTGTGGTLDWAGRLLAELEDCGPEGGVWEPSVEFRVEVDFVVGTVWWLALLEVSVRKLARDRLRRSLRNEGAMMT
jgi:hypothetical protein